jgi:hypothetical protein
MRTLIKFTTHDCPACQEIAGFDAAVAAELGFSFVDIDMKNIELYRVYRKYLLYHRSARKEIALPTYILVDLHGDNFAVHGELTGSMSRRRFRVSLEGMLQQSEFARSAEDA